MKVVKLPKYVRGNFSGMNMFSKAMEIDTDVDFRELSMQKDIIVQDGERKIGHSYISIVPMPWDWIPLIDDEKTRYEAFVLMRFFDGLEDLEEHPEKYPRVQRAVTLYAGVWFQAGLDAVKKVVATQLARAYGVLDDVKAQDQGLEP